MFTSILDYIKGSADSILLLLGQEIEILCFSWELEIQYLIIQVENLFDFSYNYNR